ncbi:hypothetical protein B1757_05145 [Acidithiobacillus marinus]|uniref:N-acetyltransferase domain-containing protein n=1 Tax=Acidithiobacillus marinus TaxID=187490 RepID=A0A2I1DN32_9PROT|nr:GNAT family N-acetyltransferase [Acidithiobacillus marinus]PKY11290.1 hypothetical protein B1757_05145 [Acidithiobacillus marinus]
MSEYTESGSLFAVRQVNETNWPDYASDIKRIFNVEIAQSPYIYLSRLFNEHDIHQWFFNRLQKNGSLLVCTHTHSDKILGFATYGRFRNFAGSLDTVEHSVYVDSAVRSKGVGSFLLGEIVSTARLAGKKSMVGVIDADNLISLHLHDKAGFIRVGCMKSLGFKWDKYRDTWFVQRILS